MGDLFDYVLAILQRHKPRFLMLENVPNLLRHADGATWTKISIRLRQLGYAVSRPKLMVKLHSVLADTLGAALLEALGQRFDEQLALSSLAFYDLSTIPAVRGPLPPQVTAVRFRSELAGVSPLSTQRLGHLMPGLAGAPPRR
jgi:hypothetical protein